VEQTIVPPVDDRLLDCDILRDHGSRRKQSHSQVKADQVTGSSNGKSSVVC
jgi:hypothetical protein